MKAKKLMVMIAALLTVGSFAGYKLSQEETNQDALTIANVEALAGGENNLIDPIQECNYECKNLTSFTCAITSTGGYSIKCHDMIKK